MISQQRSQAQNLLKIMLDEALIAFEIDGLRFAQDSNELTNGSVCICYVRSRQTTLCFLRGVFDTDGRHGGSAG